jgi:predicted transcriptional regulator
MHRNRDSVASYITTNELPHDDACGDFEQYAINEFARLLGRNYKNVHTDVTRLIELGLNGRLPDRRIAVTWDTITAEMKLASDHV